MQRKKKEKKLALFLSTFTHAIDTKGRVSVPASFRTEGGLQKANKVVIYPSFKDECLEGCDLSRMETLSEATDQLDTFSTEQSTLNDLIFSQAEVLHIDGTGRVLLPESFLEKLGSPKEIAFVGRGKTFQIWHPEKLKKSLVDKYNEAQKSGLILKKQSGEK